MRELWQKNTTFLRSVSIIRKDFVSLPTDSVTIRSKDILNSEALCFILTKREPENSLSYIKDNKMKVGNVVQLFPRILARTSVIFHLQGFSGPPLQNIDMRSALQYK